MNEKRKIAEQQKNEEMEFLKKQQVAGKDIRRRGPGGQLLKEKPKNLKGTLRRLLSYIGKSKYLLFGLFAASLFTTVIALASPVLQKEAIDAMHYRWRRILISLTASAWFQCSCSWGSSSS